VKVATPSQETLSVIKEYEAYFHSLLRLKSFTIEEGEKIEEDGFSSTAVAGDTIVSVKLPEELREREIQRLEKEMAKLEKQVESVSKKLANQGFISKAPGQIIEREKERLSQAEGELEKIKTTWKELTQ
jgi:valyl-tRNA synthetase